MPVAPVGIVTVPVQDGWADGRTDNRPVPSSDRTLSEPTVPSTDSREDGRPVHQRTDGRTGVGQNRTCEQHSRAADHRANGTPPAARILNKGYNLPSSKKCPVEPAYLLTDRPSTVDGRPVHRPVPSSVVRNAAPPYRRRTVHWTAGFGAVRPPGRTVTIPTRLSLADRRNL
ncbi:hypothetical protein B0H14DRAFT_2588841 [Mycena olivaceomarginata]|nr:hypothetical protein B0H14DRAFT_2588841 [Mycena olivaceomarginata]